MNRLTTNVFRASTLLVIACAAAAGPLWAADGRDPRLDQAKTSIRAGDYRSALQTLDALLVDSPHDPDAQIYRALCDVRLHASQDYAPISAERLRTLKERLSDETRAQARTSHRRKAAEMQLHSEQERWDRELQALEHQSRRDKAARKQQAQTEALARAQAERARALDILRRHTAVPSPAAAPVSPATPPEAPEPEPPQEGTQALPERRRPRAPATVTETRDGAVELSPVVVKTEAEESLLTPSLMGRPKPPPGAVQINAQQMNMNPDRKLAVAEGDAEVVFDDAVLTADRITLFTDTNDVYAEGRVRLEQGNEVFRGEMAHYNFNTKKGRFMQGTISTPPWHQHGRTVEHIAEGVYEVTPGYITSCDFEPPHFQFAGRRAVVFAGDRSARARNVALIVEQLPLFYLPWVSFADRQSPFFLIPGKSKQWGEYSLMGYRYELPMPAGEQKGTLKLDWRRYFGWGMGVDHQIKTPEFGKALLRVYYNSEKNRTRPTEDLPKGALENRYRVLWRHQWEPRDDTSIVTNIQKYSDVDFRRELLFREEFVEDDEPESFISVVKSTPVASFTGLVKKRLNRFQTVTEALPQVNVQMREQQIGDTMLYTGTTLDVANLETKNAHSELDTDVMRIDWFQRLRYALNWFRPIEVTPNVGIRQTYYTKDKQGGIERPQGKRNVLSGQASMGTDASLKLFRIFPVTTNALGLNINALRHVLTPLVSYGYIHRPTVPNDLLSFPSAIAPQNRITFGLENKLQTRRPTSKSSLRAVDLARFLIGLPYTFKGAGNEIGGEWGDWSFDLETYPWSWLRVESDWSYPSHFAKGSRDARVTAWNLDVIAVGGRKDADAGGAPGIGAGRGTVYAHETFRAGPRGGLELMPMGQWYLGFGHRYSHNNKTEGVIQYDRRVGEKWEINTFHRLTWKEVAGGTKRFNHLREFQYSLRRDLHDWVGELVYRVDREFGEELFLTFTLKAFPDLPIELEDSYHQPKVGSQNSPFSPVPRG